MKPVLKSFDYTKPDGTMAARKVLVRPGSSDENVFKEVLTNRAYRRVKSKFDVEPGEKWLDLGANVGAFLAYCDTRNAELCSCFEPDPDCFAVLKANAERIKSKMEWALEQKAVSTFTNNVVTLYQPNRDKVHSRGTLSLPRNYDKGVTVTNLFGEKFASLDGYDGLKMDIEGSEGLLIDCGYLPKINKLVLEYHLSRDKSLFNLKCRLNILKDRFKHVAYPPEFDKLIATGEEFGKTFFDRNIFCWNY